MKKTLIAIFLIILVIVGVVYYMTRPTYPLVVSVYQWRYSQMSTLEGREELINYTKLTLYDSIEGLDYLGLLQWEHRYLTYNVIYWDGANHVWVYPDGAKYVTRPELPIPILRRGRGACGEFSLLYIGLLLANNIECRLVVDCSTLQNQSKTAAGDHVWAEVWIPRLGRWVHVDPTEKIIDQPDMYSVKWNKDVNLVYAIAADEIVDVTDTYRG